MKCDSYEVIIIKCDDYEMIDGPQLRLLQDYHCCRDFDRGVAPGGGGVLPYVTLTGTCGPIGYGFQGVLS